MISARRADPPSDPRAEPAGGEAVLDRIAVAGNINADVVYELRRLPLPGETLLSDQLALSPGGKAANASVALARLGAAPHLIGCVGEDALGSFVLDALAREGVGTERVVRRVGAPTGLATVLVLEGGQNAILTHLGANLRLTVQDLAGDSQTTPALTGCRALLMTLGLPAPVLLELARRARQAGMALVLDATPLRGEPPPQELLAADVLSANRVEAEALIDSTIEPRRERDVLRACERLRALGASAAVLKLGAAGAAWSEGERCGVVAAPSVRAVDSTGAGDAFMAGLTLRLVQGAALPAAVAYACRLGALSATGRGAQGGWESAADVERLAVEAPV